MLLALGGCGHSDPANAPASADNVEMPAEEALSGVVATPASDPMATATDAPDTPAGPVVAASSAPSPVSSPRGGPSPTDAAAGDVDTSQ